MTAEFRIDLHTHTSELSACAHATADEQIAAAIRQGLHGIAFTDHHHQRSAAELAQLNRRWQPFRIYAGVEITAGGEDWLVFGFLDPQLSREERWGYPELHRFVHAAGGWLMLAHPFRYAPDISLDLRRFPPDGIEYRSRNTPVAREGDILDLAAELGLPALCNSDAHNSDALGQFYNRFPSCPQDDAGLSALLRGLAPGPTG